jgi:hypothetical protein
VVWTIVGEYLEVSLLGVLIVLPIACVLRIAMDVMAIRKVVEYRNAILNAERKG